MTAGGSYQQYSRHWVFYTPDDQAFTISTGGFTEKYFTSGGPTGAWGWPAGDREYFDDRSSIIRFDSGVAVHSTATGVAFMTQDAYSDWKGRGADSSPTGFPAEDTVTVEGGGSYQVFSKQTVFISPDGTSRALTNGGFPSKYLNSGGPSGSWGWLTNERSYFADRSSLVKFENGVALHSSATGVMFTTPEIYADWKARGSDKSITGFPIKDSVRIQGGGSYQEYSRYSVFIDPNGRSFMIANGKYTDEYFKAGGPEGSWGWPTGDRVYYAQGGGEIPFENGVAVHNQSSGVTFRASE